MIPFPFRITLFLAVVVAVLLAAGSATAGPKVTVGRAVPKSDRVAYHKIRHTTWDGLLTKYVDQQGRVNYQAWKASARDTALLDSYLAELSRVDTRQGTRREAYLAYWINAYNAVTIRGILREYPTSSIRNHTARLYGYNIWHDLLLKFGDSQISLNDMEHKVLRKTGEPRIHFAIVCASHSCPRLLNEAYLPETLEQQLVANTQNFFRNPENFRFKNGTFYLSSVLKWFDEDFGEDRAAQLRSIARYLPDAQSQQAAEAGRGKISYLSYDWSLNDQVGRRAARREK